MTFESIIGFAARAFIIAVGIVILWLCVLYFIDITQKKHAIRRNYPLLGRFRYLFEKLGEFLRQYFFAMDREELPFNRAERTWVYRAAKNVDRTLAFGSTRNIYHGGAIIFVNSLIPGQDDQPSESQVIGPHCPHPYHATSFFNISGMSYGAISRPAVLSLSQGAKLAGCWLNTGEGGLSEYHLQGGADLVFQIGTAKYGVRTANGELDEKKLAQIAAYEQVKMFEIKLSQGAKPGKGGILPAEKVTPSIAKARGIAVGQPSISPSKHREVDNVGQLLDLIHRIRTITQKPVGIKAVIGATQWLDELMTEINLRGQASAPDFITIDSADGGSGAAPQSLMDYVGLGLRESLPIVVDKLSQFGLRERVKVITSGKLIDPANVAWALCMGADFIVSARGFMFSLGCIQALQCNKNTCPTGITTHDPSLQKGLDIADKSIRVANYVKNLQDEVNLIAHSCGVSQPRQLNREHIRVMQANGRSVAVSSIFRENPPKTPNQVE